MDIYDVSDEYKVWAISSVLDPTEQLYAGQNAAVDAGAVDVTNAVFCVPDPRVPQFGQRVIFKCGEGWFSCIRFIGHAKS